jgi:excisionase family DNA binding protein
MKNQDQAPIWCSVPEIARYLGVSKETIYRLLDKKKIPAHRLGKLWKFNSHEIDKWMKRK